MNSVASGNISRFLLFASMRISGSVTMARGNNQGAKFPRAFATERERIGHLRKQIDNAYDIPIDLLSNFYYDDNWRRPFKKGDRLHAIL